MALRRWTPGPSITIKFVLGLLLAAGTSRGQDLIQAPAADDLQGAAPNGGVYVHDSAVALDRMALAQRLENLKEWNKSAEVYQDIIEKYSDRVVPSGADENGVIDQYKSVLARVDQHIAAWPPEGLAVYRTRYELAAKNLLNSAHGADLGPLHQTFTRYFATDSGKQAGLRLVDAYFELGDFPAAAWIGQALLSHPTLDARKPAVLFRIGLAAHLAGDDRLAKDALKSLADKYPAAVGTIAGRDVVLAEALRGDLAQIVKGQAPAEARQADDSWPMFGGDATRGRASFATARPGARLYSIPLPRSDWKMVQDPAQRNALLAQDQAYRHDGKALDIIPVADRGQLFFQDNAHVYAVNVQTGAPLPGWLATYPGDRGEYSVPKAWNLPVAQQCSLTLTDTSVLAVMDQQEMLASMYGLAVESGGSLVCLDRQTGKEKWTLTPHDLADDALKSLRLTGSPLAVGSNVYVAARNIKGNGYEDSYVICLDAANGAFRWACYVAGAANLGTTLQDQNQQTTSVELAVHLSYASGRVFVATDMGAVAAIDAYTGAIDWLDIYRQASDLAANQAMMPPMGMGRFWPGRFGGGGFGGTIGPQAAWEPPAPWTANAPIIHDGNVFVLPADGKDILIYDAGSGKLIEQISKADCCRRASDLDSDATSSQPLALLTVLDGASVKENGREKPEDLLLVATHDSVCAIRWRQYDPDRPTAALAWGTAHIAGESLRGRPFVTADSVFIPAPRRLIRVSLETGSAVQFYPAEGDYPAGEGPGNVLVCGDHVVIAGDANVAVYTDVTLAQAKLEAEIAAAPNDAGARLRYAEVMFLANKPDQAASRLDEAVRLLDAAGDAAPRDARDRAFEDAVSFAAKSDPADAAFADELFDRAARLARSPGEQVKYRLSRARCLQAHGDAQWPAAMKLYQEILADPSMRTAPAQIDKAGVAISVQDTANPAAPPDLEPDMTQAVFVAWDEIQKMLQNQAGRDAYQVYERAAQTKLEAAIAANNGLAMAAVADEYPNSSVAIHAQDVAAQSLQNLDKPREALGVLRRIYLRHMDIYARAALLVEMSREYLQIPGGAATAAGRLARALRLDPSTTVNPPMLLPDGQPIAQSTPPRILAAIRKAALQQPTAASSLLPALGLPSHSAQRAYIAKFHQQLDPFEAADALTIDNVGELVQPDADFARPDRLAAWSAGRGLLLYPAGSNQPLGTVAQITDPPGGADWINSGKDLAVWTHHKLTLIDGDKTAARWTLDFSRLPLDAVMQQTAPRSEPRLIQQMDPRQLRRRWRGGLLPGLNRPFVAQPLPTGADDSLPDMPPSEDSSGAEKPEAIVSVQPVGELLITTTSRGRVAAVMSADGSVAWQIRLANSTPDRVVSTGDFTVIKSTDEPADAVAPVVQLAVLDTQSGRLLARKLFTEDTGQYPINIALGDDGTLACTMPDQLVLRDLFQVGLDGNFDGRDVITTGPFAGKIFNNMTRPGQLLLYHGQVLALCDEGKSVHGYDAETGEPREYRQPAQNGAEPQIVRMELPTGDGTDQTVLRVSGGYVYAVSPDALAAYNLEHPEVNWGPHKLGVPGAAKQLLLGSDYLVLLSSTEDPTHWWLSAFSRLPVANKPGIESGALVFTPQRVDPAGIVAWQPVDGGVAYLAGDHRLHVLRGSGPANPAP